MAGAGQPSATGTICRDRAHQTISGRVANLLWFAASPHGMTHPENKNMPIHLTVRCRPFWTLYLLSCLWIGCGDGSGERPLTDAGSSGQSDAQGQTPTTDGGQAASTDAVASSPLASCQPAPGQHPASFQSKVQPRKIIRSQNAKSCVFLKSL